MTSPVRVLIVDDSAVMRMVLRRVVDRAEGLEIVGIAADGLEALDAVRRLDPDVVTMDIEMPGLDGLATLRRLLEARPTRVVMLSRATRTGAEITMEALRAGAVDAIAKPDTAWGMGPTPFEDELISKIRAAAQVPLENIAAASVGTQGLPAGGEERGRASVPRGVGAGSGSGAAGAPAARASALDRPRPAGLAAKRLIVIATSTGGPRALGELFAGLHAPVDAAVIVIQHMLTGFTEALAERLDRLGDLAVMEAADGDRLLSGRALLAPGDRHITVTSAGRVGLVNGDRVNGLRPAADVTLSSAAPIWGPRLMSIVLTGMGQDGTAGSRTVHQRGGFVIAQDRATAAVYGMPRAVVEAGIADRVLALDDIPAAIEAWLNVPVAVASHAQPRRTLLRRDRSADTSDSGRNPRHA